MFRAGGAVVAFVLGLLLSPPLSYAQVPAPATASTPELSVAQIKDFLKNAKVVKVRNTDKGVTAPKRLTLSDGALTHDAVFQAIDERKMVAHLGGGARQSTTELNFIDSYKYNVAAYELAALLGLEHMMPVYVERRWNGLLGSMSWFMTTLMDESDRLKKNIQPPKPAEWNNQMYRMRVFSSLVRDTDRNLTNVLITPEWKVIMIDFSRGFRLQPELMHEKDLARIDRTLLARLEALTKERVNAVAKDFLVNREIDAMLVRRDMLVAHFKKLIGELGEDKVLY